MAERYGKCTNFGLCSKADTHESQKVPENAEFVCGECRRQLTPAAGMAAAGGDRRLPILLVAILLGIIFGGGGYFLFHRPSAAGSDHTATAVTTSSAPPMLRLSGSNTIGSQLGPDLVEAWLASKGATDVKRSSPAADETVITGTMNGAPMSVAVKAHGSATAFTDLENDAADIGMASRKIKPQEAADSKAKGLGDLTSNGDERVVGLDGVAVIVNEANASSSMSKDEVAGIFAGESSSSEWNIYARDAKSGTYDTFKDRVLESRSLAPGAKRLEDSRALASAVAGDQHGIGFVGLPYAVGVKILAISEKGTRAMIPNTMTVRTEAYPLSRRLYLYVPDNAKADARDFVRFALSQPGQDIVGKDGFVGQKVDVVKEQVPADAPGGYMALMPTADRLSVDFRFRTGSSELDSKAIDDLKRVAAAMSTQYAGRGVMLVGFADSTGGPASNLKLSKDRAQTVARLMEPQGITPVYITGFGQELPVADNSTPEGREKNRRVEVWLRK